MKLLVDTCVSRTAVEELRRHGHDVVWSGDWDRDPGDPQILEIALREGRAVVTLDRDFGELAVLHGLPHAGIVRLVGFRAGEQGAAAVAAIRRYGDRLAEGALITADPRRVRIRMPEPPAH